MFLNLHILFPTMQLANCDTKVVDFWERYGNSDKYYLPFQANGN